MPELVKNNEPKPLWTYNQLLNFITLNSWINTFPGSSGMAGVVVEGGVPKLVIWHTKDADPQAVANIRLRLTSEGRLPDEQVTFDVSASVRGN